MTLNAKSILKYTFITLISVGIVFYVFSQAKVYLNGPQLSITYPENGASTTTPEVTIRGLAQNVSFMSLNDRQIFHNENGIFSEKLLLSPGYNIIEVKVTDRFERKLLKRLHIVYINENETVIDIGNNFIDNNNLTSTSTPPTRTDSDGDLEDIINPEDSISTDETDTEEITED